MRANLQRVASCSMVLLLLSASVVAADQDRRLIEAVRAQDQAAVRTLLQEQVDVNTPQGDGATALHWAAYLDDLETAELLIRAGARADVANDFGVGPLSLASTNGNAAMIELLVEAGADPNAVSLSGETPLMTAARTGKVDAVDVLLAHGADVNAKEPSQEQTALMWALSERHLEVAQTLIERGADVNARSRGGFSPVLFAARQGDLDATRFLLASGANVNDEAEDGSSVLLVATVRGHSDLTEYLLDQGADPNAADAGYTALHWAAGTWETEMTGPNGIVLPEDHEWSGVAGLRAGRLALVRSLLEHGADPNALLERQPPRVGYTVFSRRPLGATPFFLAAMAGDADVMRVLVDAGADPLLAPRDQTTPLMTAAGVRRNLAESGVSDESALEAVKLAVELGADVNAVDDQGDTALHGAARIKADAIVQLLVDQGATINVKNLRGQTPLFIAERYFHPGSAPLVERTSTGDLLRKLAVQEAVQNWDSLSADVKEAIENLLLVDEEANPERDVNPVIRRRPSRDRE